MEITLAAYFVNPVCCNGCGACAVMAPELFAMDEDIEKPVMLRAEAPVEDIERAMAFCPHDCIEHE